MELRSGRQWRGAELKKITLGFFACVSQYAV